MGADGACRKAVSLGIQAAKSTHHSSCRIALVLPRKVRWQWQQLLTTWPSLAHHHMAQQNFKTGDFTTRFAGEIKVRCRGEG